MNENLNKGIVIIEVLVPYPEKFLNLLWNNNIEISSAKRISITTLRITINYRDFDDVVTLIKKVGGKYKVVAKKGNVFLIMRLKSKKTLLIGVVLFLGILYGLSTYVWGIEIKTGDNVSPYEIRQDLKKIGIKPGMRKKDIDVYTLETKLEEINKDILWLRIRIEGSTLKVLIEEKVNPPKQEEVAVGDCTAEMGGEIKRIYVTSGTAMVTPGDFVKEGDVLITGIQGKEGGEYNVEAKGTVIANTFYERAMEVQISGTKMERTNKTDKDIYLNLWGVKIYLKKAINTFEYYDKIKENNGIFNVVHYYEKKEKEVNVERDKAIEEAIIKLEESLKKNLNNDAIISDRNVSVEDLSDGKIKVKVIFIVEQDIAHVVT